METTTLSSKGQVIIPKSIRTEQKWDAGQEFYVVVTPDGVLFRPKGHFPLSTLDEVLSFAKPGLKAKGEREIDDAFVLALEQQHGTLKTLDA